MKTVRWILPLLLIAGCTSVETRDAHMQNQIRMVQVQKEADSKLAIAEANAKVALYQALADVARTNPEQASAAVVAMAVQGVSSEGVNNNSKIVPLQPLVNEKLEFAKAFAAPLANVTTAVATAYINADVAKTQSNNAARVQINDALQDSRIVESVAGVGIAAAEASGLMVSGDNYTLSDSASISQDTISTVETTSTATTTTTETNTSSSIADSYNIETENADSYNDNSDSSDNTDNTDNSDNSDNTDNSYITYGDQQMTLQDLLAFLADSGQPYSFTVGEETYTDDDETDEGLTCIPTFEGYVCTGG
jgi:hypothetical protein